MDPHWLVFPPLDLSQSVLWLFESFYLVARRPRHVADSHVRIHIPRPAVATPVLWIQRVNQLAVLIRVPVQHVVILVVLERLLADVVRRRRSID